MTTKTEKRTLVSRLRNDRAGNFGMLAAIVLPLVLAGGGMAIDLTRVVMARASLQDAADSAALAAASALANDGKSQVEAKLLAMQFLATQMHSGGVTVDKDVPTTDKDNKTDEDDYDIGANTSISIKETAMLGNGKSYSVDIATKYEVKFNAFTRLFGQKSTELNARSSAESATESKNALSMFLVLDKSGSRAWITNEKDKLVNSCINWTEANWGNNKTKPTSPCYVSKMAALKLAVASLFTQFAIADPTNTFVRTGAIAYDSATYSPSELAWGSTASLNYVNQLVADGGTASGTATKNAYNKLMAASENNTHKAKNGQVPTKYLVLMTDGANNSSSDDTSTKSTCTTAKANGVEIYTVAFMAPTAGQNLLKACATDAEHYFEAANMAALVAAFKVIGERTSAVVSRLTK